MADYEGEERTVHEMRGFTGVDYTLNPSQLPPEVLSDAENVWAPLIGILGKRPGSISMASLGAGTTQGLHRFYRTNGNTVTIWALDDGSNTRLYSVTDAGAVTTLSGGTTFASGPIYFAQYLNVLYACGSNGNVMKSYNGTTLANIGGSWTSARMGLYPMIYRDRLTAAGGANLPGQFYWSDTFQPTSMSAGTQWESVQDRDGDVITGVGLLGVGTDTSGITGAYVVFKNHSTWTLTGDPANTSNPVQRVSGRVGCASQRTVANTPHGLIWLGHDDVYLLQSNSEPVAIGGPIRAKLALIPAGQRVYATGVYFNKHYVLSICPAGQSTNREQYWLDLRVFPDRLSWWGPMRNTSRYSFRALQVLRGDDRPVGSISTDVTEQLLGAMDTETRLVWAAQNTFDDRGTAYSFNAGTHEFGSDLLWMEKVYRKWGANMRVDASEAVTATVSIDDGLSTYSRTVTVTSAAAQWGVAQWGVGVWGGTYFTHLADSLDKFRRGTKAKLTISHNSNSDFRVEAMQLLYERSQRWMEG